MEGSMKIEKLWFSFEQLAAHWNVPIDNVVQMGLSNQLKIMAQADWEYPGPKIIQRGRCTPITSEEMFDIVFAKEPFSLTGAVAETTHFGIMRGDECIITFYPGISRLIIDADEVKRFEGEQFQEQTTLTEKERNQTKNKQHDNDPKSKPKAEAVKNNNRRNEIANKWLDSLKPGKLKTMTHKEINDALIEFSKELGLSSLFITGGLEWLNRDHSVIRKKQDR